MLDCCGTVPGIYYGILDGEGAPAVNPWGNGVWCTRVWLKGAELHLLGLGDKTPAAAAGICLAPRGLLTEVKLFCFPLQSSVTWALHSLLQRGELMHWEVFVAIIRIETCNILMSVHTFGHGFLSLHLSPCSICPFLTASACWADVFRELSAATPRSFPFVVTINLKFSNV